MSEGPTIFPAIRYRDAKAAIAFLCDVFGFERLTVYEAPDGSVVHAELTIGNGIVMLGQDRQDDLPLHPAEGGSSSVSLYVYVPDADLHMATAKAHGARIVREVEDTPYGSREYACLDLDGNLWSFGTYRPEI